MQTAPADRRLIVTKDDPERDIRGRLAEIVGANRYKVWFHNSTKFALSEGFLKVGVPNLFIGTWIENHFADAIAAAAREVAGKDVQVSFSIEPGLFANLRKAQLNSQAEFVQKSAERGARDPRMAIAETIVPVDRPRLRGRLEQFVVGPGNELAHSVIRGIVDRPGQVYNPVFLFGGCGIGKTHLLHGLANALTDAKPHLRWRYVSGEVFTNEFLLALKHGKLEQFRRHYRAVDVLVVDDVHFLSNKRATQDEFLHTFNTIESVGKQVVLASDAPPKMIGQLSESLVSRFVSGVVVRIDPPDLATRCEILRRRAALLGRTVPDDVLHYVAERIETNVRELEGTLLRLVAAADVARSNITMALARGVLDDHLHRTVPILNVGDIESAVATFFGLTPADLHSSRKSRTIALARNIAMYLARTQTSLSLPEIGRLMGNKNHTTVLLAHRKIDRVLRGGEQVQWNSAAGPQSGNIRELVGRIEESLRRKDAPR
ncbi:MAG: chromosomal replication initiator protein DnaA [Phycisphaerae bacterium]